MPKLTCIVPNVPFSTHRMYVCGTPTPSSEAPCNRPEPRALWLVAGLLLLTPQSHVRLINPRHPYRSLPADQSITL